MAIVSFLRRPSLQLMRLPALVAVLLLALLPTFGRIAQPSPHLQGSVIELCTAQGLKAMHVAAAALTGDHASMPGHPMDPTGDDCGYCPLLAGLVLAFAVMLGLLASRPIASPLATPRTFRPTWHHPSGLGSRGPPAQAWITA